MIVSSPKYSLSTIQCDTKTSRTVREKFTYVPFLLLIETVLTLPGTVRRRAQVWTFKSTRYVVICLPAQTTETAYCYAYITNCLVQLPSSYSLFHYGSICYPWVSSRRQTLSPHWSDNTVPYRCHCWKRFPHCVRGIHLSPVVSWRIDIYLPLAWISCWTNGWIGGDFYTMVLMWRHCNAHQWWVNYNRNVVNRQRAGYAASFGNSKYVLDWHLPHCVEYGFIIDRAISRPIV